MNIEKRQALIIGCLGIVFGILFCALALWILSFETATDTTTYSFLGLSLTGRVLAAIVGWLGLIIIFFSIRKMVRCSIMQASVKGNPKPESKK